MALIPVYIVMLNLFGFVTLPLYLLTPETKRASEMQKAVSKRWRDADSGSGRRAAEVPLRSLRACMADGHAYITARHFTRFLNLDY